MPEPKDVTVLLAEDSGMTRKMVCNMLKSIGYKQVIEAVDGLDAKIQIEAGAKPDVIVSDWNMPEMDGYGLLQWVRANEATKETPFLMATAQGDKKQVNMALDAGASGVLAKPFPPDELKRRIGEVLEGTVQQKETEIKKHEYVKKNGKVKLRIAHIQITDHLALGVLKNMIETSEVVPSNFELETVCYPGWNPVQAALENGDVDGAFVLAPIAMDLYRYNVPIKLVLLSHRGGSICVRNKKLVDQFGDNPAELYKDRVMLIPHKMSVHNMLAHEFLTEVGLKPGVPIPGKHIDVRFEVVPPIKMPEFMDSNDNVAGFIVAEPLGSKAINMGIAERQFFSNERWNDHPCCALAMRKEITENENDAVHEFINNLVRAGDEITYDPIRSAHIAVSFLDPNGALGLKVPVLEKVLTEPKGLRTGELFPVIDDFERIQRYMFEKMDTGDIKDMEDFVDTQFAKFACGM